MKEHKDDMIEKYKERIQKLETDNAILRNQLADVTDNFLSMVHKLPLAAAVCDKYYDIVAANRRFVVMFGADADGLDDNNESLAGVNVREVVPEAIFQVLKRGVQGEDIDSEIAHMSNKNIAVSVFSFARREMILVTVRNLYDPAVVNEDIAERLRQTIDRKMEMVQKIGALLGEEVSVVAENLNSVIKIIESPRSEE